MKKTLLITSLTLSILATACGENASTPVPGAQNQNGVGYQYTPTNQQYPPQNNPQNYVPGQPLPANYPAPNQDQYNMNTQAQIQAQAMLSWQARVNTPNYYSWSQQYSNCLPRPTYRAKVYRTNSCSNIHRDSCSSQVYVVRIKSKSCSSEESKNCEPAVTTETPKTDEKPKNVPTVADTTEVSKVKSLDLTFDDAKALYERLAVKKEEESKQIHTRTGKNIKCTHDKNGLKKDIYTCNYQIVLNDGSLITQTPSIKNDGPETTTSYQGSDLVIGGPGKTPTDAEITIKGVTAEYLAKNLPTDSKQVKCAKNTKLTGEPMECIIKIKSDTGEVL